MSHENQAQHTLFSNGRPRAGRVQRAPGRHRRRIPPAAGTHIPAAIPPRLLFSGKRLLRRCTMAHSGGRQEFLWPGRLRRWHSGRLRPIAGPAIRFALDGQDLATTLAGTSGSGGRGPPAPGAHRLCFAVDRRRLSFPGLVLGRLRVIPGRMGFVAAHPKLGLSFTGVALVVNIFYPGDRQPPSDWKAVDTHFGAISHGPVSPLREYLAAQSIQAQAAGSSARVVVFPESVVPRWTTSTDLFGSPRQIRFVEMASLP